MSGSIDWQALQQAAAEVMLRAHAPYSRFSVGAALLGDDGAVFVGCNVENASYGLSVCAERNAVAAAVAAGCRRFSALAIVTAAAEPTPPCGACRQVLHEFSPPFEVRAYTTGGKQRVHRSDELLPGAFDADCF